MEWSGQWENQIRANKTLSLILPIVVTYHILIFYIHKSMRRSINNDDNSSFALIEGFYGLFYGINLSVAVAVGFIALFDGDRNSYDNDYLLERGQ
jgi:Cu(I)/Ag(I) efflux system membrane protein CusA/SilA